MCTVCTYIYICVRVDDVSYGLLLSKLAVDKSKQLFQFLTLCMTDLTIFFKKKNLFEKEHLLIVMNKTKTRLR
jgi:hypothetical protein